MLDEKLESETNPNSSASVLDAPGRPPHSGDDSNSAVMRRRKFIRAKLIANGRVTEDEIRSWQKAGENHSIRSIRNDIAFIEEYEGRNIFERRVGVDKSYEWIDETRKLGSTRKERLRHNARAKQQIGELISSIILGFGKFSFQRNNEPSGLPSAETIENLEKIKAQIMSFAGERPGASLWNKLERYWSSGQRCFFIDAGTTLQIFAEEYLQFFRLPMSSDDAHERAVNKIEAITNDRFIFNCLGDASVEIKTIMIGGRQQFRSASTSGLLAERFVTANDLRANIAIVSATSISYEFFEASKSDDEPNKETVSSLHRRAETKMSCVYAENEHFAAMKRMFLERSEIRIVVADSTKFLAEERPGDVHVCPLRPREIDLVITNSADELVTKHFRKLEIPLISYDVVSPKPK